MIKLKRPSSLNTPTALCVRLASDFTRWLKPPLTRHKQAEGIRLVATSLARGRRSMKFIRKIVAGAAVLLCLMLFGSRAWAADVLANASMESGLTHGWTCYGRTGQEGWYSYALAWC